MENAWEEVYGETDYYDGPRAGMANFLGHPHSFESNFDETEGAVETFRLKPIDAETLSLFRESFAIWLRWKAAFHNKTLLPEDTHPSLAIDKARRQELDKLLEKRLESRLSEGIVVNGEFRSEPTSDGWYTLEKPVQVRWSRPEERRS